MGTATEWRPTDKQIDAAVEWWCAAIRQPKQDSLGPRRSDDIRSPGYWDERKERRASEFAEVMMLVYGAKLTDEHIQKFAVHLRELLRGECTHTWRYGDAEHAFKPERILCVDYDPDVFLRHCGEVAEFPGGFFWPVKTMMWLDRDSNGVRVRYGYGAEIQELVGAE